MLGINPEKVRHVVPRNRKLFFQLIDRKANRRGDATVVIGKAAL